MNDKKKLFTQFAMFAITFAIAFFVTRYFFSANKSYSDQLLEIASQLNTKTPLMIDAETRLDDVKASGDTLLYFYTLVNVTKEQDSLLNDAKNFLIVQSQKNLDSTPQMKEFRENNIALKYHYFDKNRVALFDFKISPKQK